MLLVGHVGVYSSLACSGLMANVIEELMLEVVARR
jgi:hypothetical protein